MGGGYDEVNQDLLPASTDSKGRAFFAFELARMNAGKLNDLGFLGTKIFEYSYTTSVTNDSGNALDDMTFSIPSELTILDTDGNGLMDTGYIGDMGGRMWRFNIDNDDSNQWEGKIIFESGGGRKIFYHLLIIRYSACIGLATVAPIIAGVIIDHRLSGEIVNSIDSCGPRISNAGVRCV